jgi:hypothetical protein
MRKAASIGVVIALLGAASVALAASGGTRARVSSLSQAVARTTQASSLRYSFEVRIVRDGKPTVMHVRGAWAGSTISVRVRMGDQTMPDGTVVPGPDGAALLDGPFLYERAPSFIVVLGKVTWLRLPVASLSPRSGALQSVHELTPSPLLRVLDEAHAAPTTPAATLFRGPVAYDDPIVVAALAPLSGGLQFRNLHVSASIWTDGLVHGIVIAGRTADGKTTLRIGASLYAFGKPLQVTPPAEGTFLDKQLLNLSE